MLSAIPHKKHVAVSSLCKVSVLCRSSHTCRGKSVVAIAGIMFSSQGNPGPARSKIFDWPVSKMPWSWYSYVLKHRPTSRQSYTRLGMEATSDLRAWQCWFVCISYIAHGFLTVETCAQQTIILFVSVHRGLPTSISLYKFRMAELVGLASSIAALAAAGFHVARKISTVADDLGTASGQIKSIAVDTKAVAIILRDIEAKLLLGKESSRELNDDTRDVLVEVLELCRYEIEDLDRNLAPLKDDSQRGDNTNVRQKTKWLFDKPKIAARQTSLNSLKLTLSLLLHNVHLFDGERSQ